MKLAMAAIDELIGQKNTELHELEQLKPEDEAERRKLDARLDTLCETIGELHKARNKIDPDCRHK